MAFTIDMSTPFPSGFTGGLGGPADGGHGSQGEWYNRFGMDLGAGEGTQVFAAFDAHVTKHNPHNPANDRPKQYGAELFMRSANDKMGAFYTHITNVPGWIVAGAIISRGDLLGTIHAYPGTGTHLHMALVEIIGGAPGGQYVGVNLYDLFLASANTGWVSTVTFNESASSPPTYT